MKLHHQINITVFTELIAEEQQRLANKYLRSKDESEADGDVDEIVPRSRKFNEKNLFPHV